MEETSTRGGAAPGRPLPSGTQLTVDEKKSGVSQVVCLVHVCENSHLTSLKLCLERERDQEREREREEIIDKRILIHTLCGLLECL